MLTTQFKIAAAALGVGLAAVWWLKGQGANVVLNTAAAGVGVVGDAAAGVVIGAGDILGIPRTNESECDAALREGRTWDASFACPAGRFIKSVFD